MVNLSIDAPSFGRSSGGGGGLGRLVVWLVLLMLVFGGGFFLGRRTAPQGRAPEAATAVAEAPPPAPSSLGSAAPSPVTGPSSGTLRGAQGPAPLPVGGAGTVAAQPPAAVTPPGAPQGPLVRRASIVLRGALEDSVAQALAREERAWAQQLTAVANRLLVWSLQVSRDGRKGDKLDILYELPTAQPTEVMPMMGDGPVGKEPVVLGLRYGSQKLGRVITAYRHKPQNAPFARYYTAEGVDVEDHLVDSPIEGYEQITSLLRDGRRHKGVDFKTPTGTSVKSPFEATVVRRNWNFSSNGNCLELVDRSGRHAIYLHLEAAPKEMQPGRAVRKGEEIAKSGNSGHSTAPHLHFQLEDGNGKVLDPFAVMPTKKVTLEGPAKVAFDVERQKLEPMLLAQVK